MDKLGPPSDPIAFPPPQIRRGRRDNALCYSDETGGRPEVVQNVLFQDDRAACDTTSSANASTAAGGGGAPSKFAYWRIPYKEPFPTTMGHVEICRVLERYSTPPRRQQNGDGEADDGGTVLFQWTKGVAAVKVIHIATMERLRGRYAQDPLQEIAALQLLGDRPVHVIHCIDEVLSDE